MTDNTTLETTIDEPSVMASEVELLFALERSRAQFAWKSGGLDAAGPGKPHPPSAMTLGGPLEHLAFIEDYHTARDLTGQMGGPWNAADFEGTRDWEWRSAADDSPEELYAIWRGAVEQPRAAWAAALANGGLDQPSRFTTESGESPNLRRVLVDLHGEYARHVGNDPPPP
jgi:hypothetical protein